MGVSKIEWFFGEEKVIHAISSYLEWKKKKVILYKKHKKIQNLENYNFLCKNYKRNYFSLFFWQIVANSWGKDWGQNGYFRIKRGVNECEIEDFVVGAWAQTDKHLKQLRQFRLMQRRLMQNQRHRRHHHKRRQFTKYWDRSYFWLFWWHFVWCIAFGLFLLRRDMKHFSPEKRIE